jgi:hypothetical protein
MLGLSDEEFRLVTELTPPYARRSDLAVAQTAHRCPKLSEQRKCLATRNDAFDPTATSAKRQKLLVKQLTALPKVPSTL